MKTLRFYKVSPGGNSTILVLDPVPNADRGKVAQILMSTHHLQGEQVGFLDLEADPVRLDMMGGEFCGNACRASAAVMVQEKIGLREQEGLLQGKISVSGAQYPLHLKVDMIPKMPVYWLEMPVQGQNLTHGVRELEPGLGLVSLPGIDHFCLYEQIHPFPVNYIEQVQNLRQRYGLQGPAVGCIWYQTTPAYCIKPVVWVRETASTHFETGCGSGSLALALWLGYGQKFPLELEILQPSGSSISVLLSKQKATYNAWIYGPVSIIAKGEVYLP